MKARNKVKRSFLSRMMTCVLAMLMSISLMPVRAEVEYEGDEYIYGETEEYSTFAPGEMLEDSFYYSDSWFNENPYDRNDALALVSLQLTAGIADDDPDSPGVRMLKKLGYENITFIGFDPSNSNNCAFVFGTKDLNGTQMVAAIIQSYAFDAPTKAKGWRQNFNVNDNDFIDEPEHYALNYAADFSTYALGRLAEGKQNTRYWIMGQSRGGAIANITAKELDSFLKSRGYHFDRIYAYTFEAPAVVNANSTPFTFGYIHNYICTDDPVTKLPMWGMVRYGQDHVLNTEQTNAGMRQELLKLGSAGAYTEYAPYEGLDALIKKLEDRVSAKPGSDVVNKRSDYSKIRTDEFQDKAGESVKVVYDYQSTLINLMTAVFGGSLSGLNTGLLLDNLDPLTSALHSLVAAVKAEQGEVYDLMMKEYWDAAVRLHELLTGIDEAQNLSLTTEDIYVLLRLAGPLMVDTSFEAEEDYDGITVLMGYLQPALNLVLSADSFTYSHHFDSLIARLKVLAPQPSISSITVEGDAPTAGETLQSIKDRIATAVEGFGLPWLTLESAEIKTDDQALAEGKTYFLTTEFRAVGHVPAENGVTVKVFGEDPAEAPQVSYEEGATLIKAVFRISTGATEKTVTFVTGRNVEAPAPLKVDSGECLRYISRPAFVEKVTQDGKTWLFNDWYDEAGNNWDDVIVNDDMNLIAHWLEEISRVDIQFAIPDPGEKFSAPAVAQDASYTVSEYGIIDSHYNDVEEADHAGRYELYVSVSVDPDKGVFALGEPDEYGDQSYSGKLYINGEEIRAEYSDYEGPHLIAYYKFSVGDMSFRFVEGDGQIWETGSEQDLKFVVRRMAEDERTFDYFEGIEIDGVPVDEENYTAEEGSVRLTLKAQYLETLEEGTHRITALFGEEGSAAAEFEIRPEGWDDHEIPDTGDASGFIWLAMMISSLGAAAFIRRRED